MRAVLALAGLGWRRLWRDPLGLAFTFLAPVVVAAVMVGIYRSQDPRGGYPVGVVVDGEGAVGADLLGRLEANPVLEVERYDDRRGAERAVRRRDVVAAVVVPPMVETRADGAVSAVTVGTVDLVGPPEVAAPGTVRAAVEAAVAETAAALQLGRALAPEASTPTALATGRVALDLARGTDGPVGPPPSAPGSQGAAVLAVLGALVLFVTMNTMGASALLADLRELGIVARMGSTPASPAHLGVGVGLGLASYALVVALLMLLTGRVLFGIAWASWPTLAAVVVVLALAAGALGLATGTFLPSAESGTTVAGPTGFVLGMLGGCLWPLDLVGPALGRLGHLTPHAWAVDALRTTAGGGAGLGEVAVPLGVLLAFTAGLLLLGGRRIARMSRTGAPT